MSHPSLGLPPTAADPARARAAARLRDRRTPLARRALERALELDPKLRDRYDELALRRLLRDCEQHVLQLARSLESGDDSHVVNYGEWLVPIYRRREVPMRDFATVVRGLRRAVADVLSPEDARLAGELIERWLARLKFHGRLPGDHKGNAIVRFFWKGAGIADDSVV
ncbi:MAG TPA: hypothetical protein VFK38_05910 [Candidatus Limnocylindrales bacterium]|nr:hypothetical protein [Candidatus Limnocylindrales bacterium]